MDKKSKSKPRRKIPVAPRQCYFCKEEMTPDYKKPEVLGKFLSERGKILAADRNGLCPKHQRRLSFEVKRSRFLGLLPFIVGVK
ncbi:MAG: 30S ribosomal protein S18 [bacterium]|nr:30S ribosomal protein S18 [bacterium]